MKRLSVIIPCYNAETTLEAAVRPFLEVTGTEIEILIVDDGSTDRTPEAERRLAEQDARVRVLSNKGTGVSAARNCGIAAAEGECIMFVDSDDGFRSEDIEGLLGLMDTETDMVAFGFTQTGPQEGMSTDYSLPEGTWENGISYLKYFIYPRNHTTVWAKIFRTAVIRDGSITFPTDLKAYEDIVFLYRYLETAKGKVRQTGSVSYLYTVSPVRFTYERFVKRSMDLFPAFELISSEAPEELRELITVYYTELTAMTMRRLLALKQIPADVRKGCSRMRIYIKKELKRNIRIYMKSDLPTLFLKLFVWTASSLPSAIRIADGIGFGRKKWR